MTGESGSTAFIADFINTVWNEGNIGVAAQFVVDGYTIHHDPGDPWEGRQLTITEFQERVRTYREPFSDPRFTVHEILGDDAKVMMTWLWNAALDGKALAASGATVYYLQDGKIAGHWQVTRPGAGA